MHIAFIPYGKISEVDLLIRDMSAQKHKLPMTKGSEKKVIWIESQIRVLPFGIYEYICPKEDMDIVLTTLKTRVNRYNLSNFRWGMLRKILQLEKVPKFETKEKYLWLMQHVGMMVVGVRYDDEVTNIEGEYKGWTHEAI